MPRKKKPRILKPNRPVNTNKWDKAAQRVLALLSTAPQRSPKPFWIRMSNYAELGGLTTESKDREVTIQTRVSRASRTLREAAERMLASEYGNSKQRDRARSELRQNIFIDVVMNFDFNEWAIRVERRNNPSLSLLPE